MTLHAAEDERVKKLGIPKGCRQQTVWEITSIHTHNNSTELKMTGCGSWAELMWMEVSVSQRGVSALPAGSLLLPENIHASNPGLIPSNPGMYLTLSCSFTVVYLWSEWSKHHSLSVHSTQPPRSSSRFDCWQPQSQGTWLWWYRLISRLGYTYFLPVSSFHHHSDDGVHACLGHVRVPGWCISQ